MGCGEFIGRYYVLPNDDKSVQQNGQKAACAAFCLYLQRILLPNSAEFS